MEDRSLCPFKASWFGGTIDGTTGQSAHRGAVRTSTNSPAYERYISQEARLATVSAPRRSVGILMTTPGWGFAWPMLVRENYQLSRLPPGTKKLVHPRVRFGALGRGVVRDDRG